MHDSLILSDYKNEIWTFLRGSPTMANLRTEEFIKHATNTITKLLYKEFEPSIPDYMNKESFLNTLVDLVEFDVVRHVDSYSGVVGHEFTIMIDFEGSPIFLPIMPQNIYGSNEEIALADGWIDNGVWKWELRTYE
jgi:hypothetical protein